jgi:hypothetical protein
MLFHSNQPGIYKSKKEMWGGGQTHFLELKETQFFKTNLVTLHDTTFFIYQALKSMGLHLILFQVRNYESHYINLQQRPNFTYYTFTYF